MAAGKMYAKSKNTNLFPLFYEDKVEERKAFFSSKDLTKSLLGSALPGSQALFELLLEKLEGRAEKRLKSNHPGNSNLASQEYPACDPSDTEDYLSIETYAFDKIEEKIRRNSQRRRNRRSSDVDKLKKLYTLSGLESVYQFLSSYQGLVDLLFEAHEEIRRYFPHEEIFLEVVSDSDIDSSKELFAYISTSLPVEEAFQKLNEFDEQWFLNQLHRTNGLFNFNLRFV